METSDADMGDASKGIRVKLKVSWLEIEYEGAASHLGECVIDLVDHLLSTRDLGNGPLPTISSDTKKPIGDSPAALDFSTSTVATKLSAETGTDLAHAAAAKLSIVDGKQTFSRQELLDEMKLAPAFYKETYRNNLSKSLDRLVKADKLRLTGRNLYAISAKEHGDLLAKLEGE